MRFFGSEEVGRSRGAVRTCQVVVAVALTVRAAELADAVTCSWGVLGRPNKSGHVNLDELFGLGRCATSLSVGLPGIGEVRDGGGFALVACNS